MAFADRLQSLILRQDKWPSTLHQVFDDIWAASLALSPYMTRLSFAPIAI
jgi:hypothetical protein